MDAEAHAFSPELPVSAEKTDFEQVYQAGKAAYAAGDRVRAHDRWRDAATLDPYQEKVWVALLRVLETTEDRRVCLENILAINPANARARREWLAMQPSAIMANAQKSVPMSIHFLGAVVRGMWIGILAVGIGTGISILIYGFIG